MDHPDVVSLVRYVRRMISGWRLLVKGTGSTGITIKNMSCSTNSKVELLVGV